MGLSDVHKTARTLALRLRAQGIDFAIAGALALGAHGVVRMTEDVDVLVTRAGLQRFKAAWLGSGYIQLRPGHEPVRDAETGVRVDFLITGNFPGDGRPKPVAFPEPNAASIAAETYSVLSLPKLVELKLASGMTAPDRPGDLGDVIRLIRAGSLTEEFQNELDPWVRPKYLELWNAAQTPADEY